MNRPAPSFRLFFVVPAALTVAWLSAVCHAAPQAPGAGSSDVSRQQEAKAYFVAGSESFDKGSYRQAIFQFRKAFDIVRSPEILFNIGRCHEEMGEREDAIYHYEMYLRLSPNAEDAESVRRRIESLRGEEADQTGGAAGAVETGKGQDRDRGRSSERASGPPGIRLGLGIGVAGGVSGPSDGVAVPLELIASFPVIDWLMVFATFKYGHYFVESGRSRAGAASAYYSQNQVGGLVGLRGDWPLLPVLAATARIGFSALWIDFGHEEGKACLAGRLDGGLVWGITDHLALFADLWVSVGGMVGKEIANTPLADHTPETEIGFALGLEYVF